MHISDPLGPLSGFSFLIQHYKTLSARLDELLELQKDTFDQELKKLEVRTAKEDIEAWALEHLYPTTIRYAVFIAIYSQFEFYLNETCKRIELKHKIKLSDLKDRGITRANTYLKRVAGIDAPFSNDSWQKLTDLNNLRNSIVHANGMIEEDNGLRVIERIRSWAPIRIEERKVILTKLFNGIIFEVLNDSAKELFDELVAAGWR